ncbi:uncharacterized protein LOC141886973 [Acropora palmata]|uniref:uncharacterized protein LOC141886973 n=1 Tax=Acropora palmata TaxID=6131 RepID=UPI003DA050F0
MQHVQDCVSNAMQDFFRDDVPSESSDDLCYDHSNPGVSDEIDHFLAQTVDQYSGETQAETSGVPKDLAAEFSTNERTSSSIDDDLLKIIEGLINNKLPKERIDGSTEKYPRPENCKLLVVPKTNRAVWNQLKDGTKNAGMGMQKCQKLFMAAMHAILEASRGACGTIKANFVHALVLILPGNRELNLKRRELLRPDLNARFSALCNASTPISTEVFGDVVGKEIDEVAKAKKLGEKLASHKKGRVSHYQPYMLKRRSIGHTGQSQTRLDDRGHSKSQVFLGVRNTGRWRPTAKPGIHTKATQE